jgi:Mg2+/Co2+ transporter CorB
MEMLLVFILVIIASVVLSAFFAAAETAITGVSQAAIHRLELEGNKRAKLVVALRADKERLISALLLGNSACNVLSSALATSSAISIFGGEGVIYATMLMTIIIIVFAEVLPKSYAFEYPERTALALAPTIVFLIKILYPAATIVHVIVNKVLSMIVKSRHGSLISAKEELRGAIELHHKEGAVIKHDRDMLGGILDLDDTTIDEVMIHRRMMSTINMDDPPEVVINQIMTSPHTRIPVWKDNQDNIVGIINIKDFLRAIKVKQGRLKDIRLNDILMQPWFVSEKTTLREQLNEFRKKRTHFALVVDEYGALMGLVTLEDILEEIVGHIEDEHDHIVEGIQPIDEHSYILQGMVTIRDINRQLEWGLPDLEANTIAGLIMHEAKTVPEEGESVVVAETKLTVLKRFNNQIQLVKADRLSAE